MKLSEVRTSVICFSREFQHSGQSARHKSTNSVSARADHSIVPSFQSGAGQPVILLLNEKIFVH